MNISEMDETTGEIYNYSTFIWDEACDLIYEDAWINDIRYFRTLHIIILLFSSLSLIFLIPAVIIYLGWSSLRCTKNYIHANLMISFILKCLTDLINNSVRHLAFNAYLENSYNEDYIQTSEGHDFPYHIPLKSIHERNIKVIPNKDKPSLAIFYQICCISLTLLQEFALISNHFWLMNEGIYLYNLLNLTRMAGDMTIYFFLIIGWCVPLFFIFLFIIIQMVHNEKLRTDDAINYEQQTIICWERTTAYSYIVRVPIIIAVLINFIIFVAVAKTISSKMKRDSPGRLMLNVRETSADGTHTTTSYPMENNHGHGGGVTQNSASVLTDPPRNLRLIKSILMLIPLLGVQYSVVEFLKFIGNGSKTMDNLHIFISRVGSSIAGFLVAYWFCFCNQEVKATLRREFLRRSRSLTSLSAVDGRRRSSVTYAYRHSLVPNAGGGSSSRMTASTRLDEPLGRDSGQSCRSSGNIQSANVCNINPTKNNSNSSNVNPMLNQYHGMRHLGIIAGTNGTQSESTTNLNNLHGLGQGRIRNENSTSSTVQTGTGRQRLSTIWSNFKFRLSNFIGNNNNNSSSLRSQNAMPSNRERNYSYGGNSSKRLLESISTNTHSYSQANLDLGYNNTHCRGQSVSSFRISDSDTNYRDNIFPSDRDFQMESISINPSLRNSQNNGRDSSSGNNNSKNSRNNSRNKQTTNTNSKCSSDEKSSKAEEIKEDFFTLKIDGPMDGPKDDGPETVIETKLNSSPINENSLKNTCISLSDQPKFNNLRTEMPLSKSLDLNSARKPLLTSENKQKTKQICSPNLNQSCIYDSGREIYQESLKSENQSEHASDTVLPGKVGGGAYHY